jgi:hypothetical protein
MPVFTIPGRVATKAYEVGTHTVDLLVPPTNAAFPPARTFPRLAPYQELAARQLVDQKYSALFAVNTLANVDIASEVAATYLDQPGIERVIILSRSSRVTNWAYLTNSMGYTDVWVPSGAPGPRWRNYATCAARFFVVPYSLLVRDIEALLPLMPSSLLITDDVSMVRRQGSERSLDTLRLRRSASACITLVQSPHQYGADEWNYLLWSALDPNRQDRETTRALARHLRDRALDATGVVIVSSKD